MPLLVRASALVTDHGGLTSHAAIVARELGVLAVLGCGDATTRLGAPSAPAVVTVQCRQDGTGIVVAASPAT
ncbi:MAG: PEP-utilizing enzyme, partial [Microthrixaceae bacterium]